MIFECCDINEFTKRLVEVFLGLNNHLGLDSYQVYNNRRHCPSSLGVNRPSSHSLKFSFYLFTPSDPVSAAENTFRAHVRPLPFRQTEVGVVERLNGCVENHSVGL